jgi:hypothetical protein
MLQTFIRRWSLPVCGWELPDQLFQFGGSADRIAFSSHSCPTIYRLSLSYRSFSRWWQPWCVLFPRVVLHEMIR